MPLQPKQFEYAISNLEFMMQDFKESLFKKVTRDSVPLFLRGKDTINITPSVVGRHEVDVEEVILWAANSGHQDFLIDIGANIGLTSCLCGNKFKNVFCYEPNPLAFKILEVNTKVALGADCNVQLFNFAIGSEDSVVDLIIPKNNWGGAYIVQGNSYDEKTLLKKDGYSSFDPDNYLRESVTIRPGADVLKNIFEALASKGGTRGVIKIDAEGYEIQILQALSEAVRLHAAGFEMVVVFENQQKQQLTEAISSLFGGGAQIFEIKYKKVRGATLVRFIKSLFGAKRSVSLEPCGGTLPKGNFALLLAA